jgi:hypothetical protein
MAAEKTGFTAEQIQRQHTVCRTEIPYTCFTAGRLHLQLNEPVRALACYARGIRHLLAGTNCVPSDMLAAESAWLLRESGSQPLTDGYLWVCQALDLARSLVDKEKGDSEVLVPKITILKVPVLIVAGGACHLGADVAGKISPMLSDALAEFRGTVISGGTTVGIPGCVGEIAGALAARGNKAFDLVGYLPRLLPKDAPCDKRYDRVVASGDRGFSPDQIIRTWQDIIASGIDPKDVLMLGVGGGDVSSVEYRLALGFGASVAVVKESGGAADALIADPWWTTVPNLLVMPFDAATLRAFIIPPEGAFTPEKLEEMAQAFHKSANPNVKGEHWVKD